MVHFTPRMDTYLPLPQIAALAQSQRLGITLAEDHPEIASFYKQGSTTLQLARQYLPDHVAMSKDVAMNAVRYALKQLLPSDELRLLAKVHQRERGITAGTFTLQNGTGIHAQSLEERMAAAKSGYQQGLGQCSETVLSYARLKGLLARGQIPYSDEEKSVLVQLANDPSYQYPLDSKHKGKPAYNLIRAELWRRFGVSRTPSALRVAYSRLTKNTISD